MLLHPLRVLARWSVSWWGSIALFSLAGTLWEETVSKKHRELGLQLEVRLPDTIYPPVFWITNGLRMNRIALVGRAQPATYPSSASSPERPERRNSWFSQSLQIKHLLRDRPTFRSRVDTKYGCCWANELSSDDKHELGCADKAKINRVLGRVIADLIARKTNLGTRCTRSNRF